MANAVAEYSRSATLFDSERAILDELSNEISNSRILDIGVGGGRTTKHLLDLSSDYVGIDYVPELVAKANDRFPNAKLGVGDARDLRAFSDESFDFVLFSFNGLDALSPNDRLLVLAEVYRVLRPHGVFMFSSHNRDYKYFNRLPWRRKFQFDQEFLRFFAYCMYHLPNHWRMRRHQIFTDEYAVVNDSDHRFSLLLYYISRDSQVRQLESAGFDRCQAYDSAGRRTRGDRSSHWLYYVARKKKIS